MNKIEINIPKKYKEYWQNLLDIPPIKILLCNIREELEDRKKEKDEIFHNNYNI